MTGTPARTGERLTIDVAQANDGNGHSTAAITLRNNCLQSQTSAALVATLLAAAGTILETKKTSIGGAISGETFRTETVTCSKLGTRVVVRLSLIHIFGTCSFNSSKNFFGSFMNKKLAVSFL